MFFNVKSMQNLKQSLHSLCLEQVNNRLKEAENAIGELQAAMANETKSSAGDKYETAREMLQQEMNLYLGRKADAKTQLTQLQSLTPEQTNPIVAPGALVYTDNAIYYLAVNAGNFIIGGKKIFCISPASPIALQLKGKKAGDEFTFNGKQNKVLKIM